MAEYGMNEAAKYATAISSLALRLGAYVFLRWVRNSRFAPAAFTRAHH